MRPTFGFELNHTTTVPTQQVYPRLVIIRGHKKIRGFTVGVGTCKLALFENAFQEESFVKVAQQGGEGKVVEALIWAQSV